MNENNATHVESPATPPRGWHRSTLLLAVLPAAALTILLVPGLLNDDLTEDRYGMMEHGWPWVFAAHQVSDPPTADPAWLAPASWSFRSKAGAQFVRDSFFSSTNLAADISVAAALLLAFVIAVEWRRRRRRFFFQLTLAEIALAMVVVGGVAAWEMQHWAVHRTEVAIANPPSTTAFSIRMKEQDYTEWWPIKPRWRHRLLGAALSQHFKHIRYLETDFRALAEREFPPASLQQLKFLEKIAPQNLGDEQLAAVAALTRVKHLHLDFHREYDLSAFGHLEGLTVNRLASGAHFKNADSLVRLEALGISFWQARDEDVLTRFASSPLTKLSVAHRCLDHRLLQEIQQWELKELRVGNAYRPGSSSTSNAPAAPSDPWSFAKLTTVEDLAVQHSQLLPSDYDDILSLPNLTAFEFNNCVPKPTDEQVEQMRAKFGDQFKHFRQLD